MPPFSTGIPADPRGPAFQIRRTPPTKPLEGCITSHELLGCYTHYYRGRTIPCEGSDCPAHADGVPFRWHSWATVFDPRTGDHFLFEVTAKAGDPLILYRKTYNTLRGCHFLAKRIGDKPNGQVIIRTQPADLTKVTLPDPPNVLAILAIIWDLPLETLTIARVNPEKQTRVIEPITPIPDEMKDQLRIMAPPLKDAPGANGNQNTA